MLALNIIAALFVIFEEWGWKPLHDLLARAAQAWPLAVVERLIARLPPYGALTVFAVPVVTLLPLKFVAMWLLANGKYWSATTLFIGAKLVSTALLARIFLLTKPQLMQISWFARAYDWFVPWKDALFETIRKSWAWRYGRMMKTRISLEVRQAWMRRQPILEARFGPQIEQLQTAARKLMAQISGPKDL